MGRTGRAGQAGAAISLLAPSDAPFAAELEAMLAASSGEAEQQQQQGGAAPPPAAGDDSGSSSDEEQEGAARRGGGGGLQPHQRLTKAAVEGLRYRAEDVARSITKNVIKEVRAALGALGALWTVVSLVCTHTPPAAPAAAGLSTHSCCPPSFQCPSSRCCPPPPCLAAPGPRQGAEERAAQLAAPSRLLRGAPTGCVQGTGWLGGSQAGAG